MCLLRLSNRSLGTRPFWIILSNLDMLKRRRPSRKVTRRLQCVPKLFLSLSEANIETIEDKNRGLLEKKWTSVVRLQKKVPTSARVELFAQILHAVIQVMDLEAKISQLQDELGSKPTRNKGNRYSSFLLIFLTFCFLMSKVTASLVHLKFTLLVGTRTTSPL